VRAPITSEALLTLADALARHPDPVHGTTVHLRRAVSTAYYALFHGLIDEATRRTFGAGPARLGDRHRLSRWYSHGELRTVSQWVIRLSRGEAVPDTVAALLDVPSPDLVEVARAFVLLQEARHEADYDHTADLAEADALAAIVRARNALDRLSTLGTSVRTTIFLSYCLAARNSPSDEDR
jgi:hypothetical protein